MALLATGTRAIFECCAGAGRGRGSKCDCFTLAPRCCRHPQSWMDRLGDGGRRGCEVRRWWWWNGHPQRWIWHWERFVAFGDDGREDAREVGQCFVMTVSEGSDGRPGGWIVYSVHNVLDPRENEVSRGCKGHWYFGGEPG